MRRREFIAGLGGAAVWPLAAHAQQGGWMRRIGVLAGGDENDLVAKTIVSAFTQGLADLGWTDGRNVRIDLRWGGADSLALELVGLEPDIILAGAASATAAILRRTRTIPIVIVGVHDSIAIPLVWRPREITGFPAVAGGWWLELLSDIAPGLQRAAIMFNPDTFRVSTYMPALERAARLRKVAPIIAPVHDDVEIETVIVALGREPRGVVMPDAFMFAHRAPIISAAARNKVPAVYSLSEFAGDGGLLSYGPDLVDTSRRAAAYVVRILSGAKPGDLPVQFPTNYEMAVNLKTAKALGLAIPPSIRRRADEMIE
jgi:putative ABC transport system substrate-binding protein